MDTNRDFKGVWICKEIWLNKDLTALDKFILTEIDSLDNEQHCIASNEYLAEFCSCSVNKVSTSISKLIKLGFIEQVSFDGRHRKLRVLKNNNQTFKNKKADLQKEKSINIDNNINNNFLNNKLFKNNNVTKSGTDLYSFCINCIDEFCINKTEKNLRKTLIQYLKFRLEVKDKPLYKNMWKGMLEKLNKCFEETPDNVTYTDIVSYNLNRGYLTFYAGTENNNVKMHNNIHWKDTYDLDETSYKKIQEKF